MAQGRADLHTHSWSSDGAQSPEDLVRAAAGRVDVLAVTDHDGIAGALRAREFARENPTLGVDVVIGEEVSTLNGHLLALYLEESVPPALPADRTIELIHAQGGLAIPAHPFHPIRYRRWGRPSLATLIPDLPLDGIEVINNSGFSSRLYDAWAASRNAEWMLAVTGGSDAHDVAYVGTAVTRFDGRDARALRRALLERRTRAHLQWTWTMRKASRHFAVKVRSFRRSRHARPPVATGPRATVSREEEPALVVGAGAAGAGRASR
jgi:predicted metal-dependent phosphoesterase TrpH